MEKVGNIKIKTGIGVWAADDRADGEAKSYRDPGPRV